MAKIITIGFFIVAIISCQLNRLPKKPNYYPVPKSFDDTVNSFTNSLKVNEQISNFALYEEKNGNPYGGDDVGAYAHFIWIQGENCFERKIRKPSTNPQVIDQFLLSSKDCDSLFDLYVDTVYFLPFLKGETDPPSHSIIIVKKHDNIFMKSFDPFPFFNSVADTLHPFYKFVREISK